MKTMTLPSSSVFARAARLFATAACALMWVSPAAAATVDWNAFRAPPRQMVPPGEASLVAGKARWLAQPATVTTGNARCHVDADATGANDGTSWADAYTHLQVALDDTNCSEIWVAEGVYTPEGMEYQFFHLGREFKLYGGFAGNETQLEQRDPTTHVTVLSGDIDHNDVTNSHGVTESWQDIRGTNIATVLIAYCVPSTNFGSGVIDGFVVTGAYSDAYGAIYAGHRLQDNSCHFQMSQMRIVGNYAKDGAGMGIFGGMSHTVAPVLTDVVFEGNKAERFGGGLYIGTRFGKKAAVTLNRVVFRNNVAGESGGGLFNDGYWHGNNAPVLRDVVFVGNQAQWGGAIFNEAYYGGLVTPELRNVTVVGNTASVSGGAVYNRGTGGGTASPIYTNVTLHHNHAGDAGGGLFNDGIGGTTSPAFVNVTLSSNSASSGTQMVSLGTNGTSVPKLTNVIVWNDAAAADSGIINQAVVPVIRNSVVQGSGGSGSGWDSSLGTDGGGNVDADPMLGPLQNHGGFTRTMLPIAGGVTIDKGDDSACPNDDQRGMSRPQWGQCDIGAVEADVWNLHVELSGSGVVSADSVPAPVAGVIAGCDGPDPMAQKCSAYYAAQAVVTLTASPEQGWSFSSWNGDCSGTGVTTQVTMSADDLDCTANFVLLPQYTVTTQLAGQGSISPASASVPEGDTARFTISPASGWHIDQVSGCGGSLSGATYTTAAVFADCTVDAQLLAGAYFTIGGQVTDLVGDGLVLRLNGGAQQIEIDANGSFRFPGTLADGASYQVSVATQPDAPQQICTASQASGTVSGSDVTDIVIDCTQATAHLSVTDNQLFARYGQIVDYTVTLTNSGGVTMTGINVSGTFSPALLANAAQWTCATSDPSASCSANGSAGFVDVATLPAGTSATWSISVPVDADSSAGQATFSVQATDAMPASDTDTLVLFRDGFEAPPASTLQGLVSATKAAAVLKRDASLAVPMRPVGGPAMATLRNLTADPWRVRLQRLQLYNHVFVRLLGQADSLRQYASPWSPVRVGQAVVLGSAPLCTGQRLILLEGARRSLQVTLRRTPHCAAQTDAE